jgi:hypothetical protein
MNADLIHPSPNRLTAFDAGLLAPEDRAAVERHVAGCPVCCRFLEGLPEDALVARIRAFVGRSTSVGADTARSDRSAEPAPTVLPPALGEHPRYRVLEPLGTGGMGSVYRAVQCHMDRVVALKVLHRHLTERPGFADRFHNEVKALARLNHPNVVAAYDADRAGDLHFLVMEFVEGESLEAAVARRGPLPAGEACELVRQAALGLAHAHAQGLVHRDIKPANLLLARSGVVKVADFGLARLVGTEDPAEGGQGPVVLGTPEYMAPEQAREPDRADVRSDLYSLGCTLYFLLGGRPPFVGASRLQTLLDHQDAAPPALVGLPAPVAALLDRFLAKDPAARFSTPAEAVEALGKVTATSTPAPQAPSAPRRRRWVLAVGAVVAASVAGGVLALRTPAHPTEPLPVQLPTSAPDPAPPALALAPAPRPVPPLAAPDQLAARRKQALEQMVGWVRVNNRWGPDAEIVVMTAARVAEAPNVDGFLLGFGSGLLKPDKKPTLLSARTGSFFEFELTPEQARGAALVPMGHWSVSHTHPPDARRATPGVRVSDLRLDGADAHPPGARINGTLTCEFPTAPGPDDHLRITHYRPDGRRVMFMHYPRRPPPAGRAALRFSAGTLEPRAGEGQRLVVVFAEWVSEKDGARVIESNTAAALLLVAARD